ncbi:GntR family transcriptional regulator [Labedella gwakjiensis]|uniref:GntR family transcriptional regulator n=1 Tax=Labedella gwakjiensis TaxID=390269 RepID=A0A2P8GVM9_9MICO|nr:GntR family transcriptional regulator [Labedella gwakjiensis]PSL38028.1 GntR family transcriptional regulator [Labedella gwakjiensis]RUQ87411.1 GntR family transcriptional regulator [Labedella gwakjiensis]
MPIPSASGVHSRSLLRDDVYLSIREAIVDGTLAPGERLRDGELESWLGVSRTPIREALLRLARAGLVIAQPGRATTVAPLDAPATLHAQQVAAAMHELAARLAVPLVSDTEIDAMEEANDRFAAALDADDADAALAADDAFHAVFVARSGNTMLAEVLEQTTPLIRRVERVRFASLAARESVHQHRAIIERTRAADADGAAALARENWLTLSRTLAD